MEHKPIDNNFETQPFVESPEDIVIAGISCRLPESDNMQEFRDHLMNNDDLLTEDDRRFPPGFLGIPRKFGKLKDTSKFDAEFFRVSPKQAHTMDAQQRILHEVVYECIVDAGENPRDLRGSNGAVVGGSIEVSARYAWLSGHNIDKANGYEILGTMSCMPPNRVSYAFDFKGPSYTVDTACSTGLVALQLGVSHVKSGESEFAIVSSTNLIESPGISLSLHRLGVLAPDGLCKSFDASADGYARSEGVVALFITKRKLAKRVYCTIIHTRQGQLGFVEEGMGFPSEREQKVNCVETYREAKIDPTDVAFVEAHVTGTKVGDPEEMGAIVDTFWTPRRKEPILVGSVKSNIGHGEAVAGLGSIAKMIIAMEERVLPANLHYKTPNPQIPALLDGRVKVVTENTPWKGGLVAVNSFGLGGTDVHAILKSNDGPDVRPLHPAAKEKRLFMCGGRHEEGVDVMLKKIAECREDVELHALLQPNSKQTTATHPYRGYYVVNSKRDLMEIQQCASSGMNVWYVFDGMGAQWPGMGKDLMTMAVFRQTIERLADTVRPLGVDLVHLLTSTDPTVFDGGPMKALLSSVAMQIGLVDLLTTVGIKPSGLVGHSFGELGCAYADGCLTAEQTILSAYWRGQCIEDVGVVPGTMAAVGLTWEEAIDTCPPNVYPACHNSEDTVTISGLAEPVKVFINQLQKQGYFAKEVNSCGIAFHSPCIKNVAPTLLEQLKKVIPEPRVRSSRWISSSVTETEWDSPLAQTASGDYFVNNFLSPVLFQEALQHVPKKVLLVEIAPHSLLQSIVKRSVSDSCVVLGLMKKTEPDNVEYFLSSLGRMYLSCVDFDPMKLHAPVSFPVARGTPMISPIIRWDHSQDWRVPLFEDFVPDGSAGAISFEYDMASYADPMDLAHKVEGHPMFTIAGNVYQAWVATAKQRRANPDETPFVLEDLTLHRAKMIPKTGKMIFNVNINPITGQFEIEEGGILLANGRGYVPTEGPVLELNPTQKPRDDLKTMNQAEIYSLLALRGLEYGPVFQGIKEAKTDGSSGIMRWNGDWMAFLDSMMQCRVITKEDNYPCLLGGIRSVRIDPIKHFQSVIDLPDGTQGIPYVYDKVLNAVICGGVEIEGVIYVSLPRRWPNSPYDIIMEEYAFRPYNSEHLIEEQQETTLRQYLKQCEKVCAVGVKSLLDNGISQDLPNLKQLQKTLNELKDSSHDTNNDSTGVLRQTLEEIFSLQQDTDFIENVQNILRSRKADITKDRLLTSLVDGPYLKFYLDDVAENTVGGRVSVAEVGVGRDKVFRFIAQKLADEPSANFDYTVTDEDITVISADEVDEYGLKTAAWNLADGAPAGLEKFDVIIASSLHEESNLREALSQLNEAIKDRGFLILHETTQNFSVHSFLTSVNMDYKFLTDIDQRTNGPFCDVKTWRTFLESEGFDVIGVQNDGLLKSLFLCRKRAVESQPAATFISVNSLSYDWVEQVKAAIDEENGVKGKIWLTALSGEYNGVTGLVACLRLEPGGDKIRCLYNDDPKHTGKFPALDSDELKAVISQDLVMNVYKGNKWGRLRYSNISKESLEQEVDQAYLDVVPGDITNLRWKDSPLRCHHYEDTPQSEQCYVYYSGINHRDIVFANGDLTAGALPYEVGRDDFSVLGMEFSGRDTTGRRVMGLLYGNGLATVVRADKRLLLPVPESWTLEQAATVPVAYTTAYYALVVRGGIKRGEKVLVHHASGGVGQAAIAVALNYGCEVFATVGSEEKRQYLIKKFPQVNEQNIATTRDRSFEFHVKRITNCRGVDVVLNTHSYSKLRAGLRILAPNARFLELERTDAAENKQLGMSAFMGNVSVHGVQLDNLMKTADDETISHVLSLVKKGLETGVVKPLDSVVYDSTRAVDAFRLMSEGKHVGKVLLRIRNEEKSAVTPAPPVKVKTATRTFFDSHKSYIIVGGAGGVGLEMINWMVERGAKHLVLTVRSGLTNAYQHRCIENWRRDGATVVVTKHSCITYEQTVPLIVEAQKLAPIGGIFNLALVGRNDLMSNQTIQNFIEVGEPKIQVTENLDKATRELCKDGALDYFVTFSSFITGRGSPAVQNYGFANAYMERIFERRHEESLPALAIQWGSIGDVGYFRKLGYSNETVMLGTVPMRLPNVLQYLDNLLTQSRPLVTCLCLAPKHVHNDISEDQDLVGAIKQILGVKNLKVLDPETTLGDLGMDSLITVEIQQLLERKYQMSLTAKETRALTAGRILDINGSSD